LINEYKKVGGSEMEFLYDFFSKYKNGIAFVDASMNSLKLQGRDLVWWCGMVHKFHQHPDYTTESLMKTRKHFKNLALTYLNDQEYKTFKSWIGHWSDLLIVTNFMDPYLWERHPIRTADNEAT
jgi:hypothetical protein